MSTGEDFELTQLQSLNYFVYLAVLHQVKNYYTFEGLEGWHIKKKVSPVDVVQIF